MGGFGALGMLSTGLQTAQAKTQRRFEEEAERIQELQRMDDYWSQKAAQGDPEAQGKLATIRFDIAQAHSKHATDEFKPHRGLISQLIHNFGSGFLDSLGVMGPDPHLERLPLGISPGAGQTTGIGPQTQLPGLMAALAGQQGQAPQPGSQPQPSQVIPTIGGGPGPPGAASDQLPQIPTVGGGPPPSQLAGVTDSVDPNAEAAAALPLSTGGRANIRVTPAVMAGMTQKGLEGFMPLDPEDVGRAQFEMRAMGPGMMHKLDQIRIGRQMGWLTPEQADEAVQQAYLGRAPSTTRAGIEQQMIDDALAAEQDKLRRPLTNQEKYDVKQRVLSQIKATAEGTGTWTASTVKLKSTGEVVPVWERKGKTGQPEFVTLDQKPIDPTDIAAVGLPAQEKLTGRMQQRVAAERIANDPKSSPEEKDAAQHEIKFLDTQEQAAATQEQIRQRQLDAAKNIVAGTPEFQVAQDLAYGRLTFAQFRGMFAYSRDADRREAIYVKARELNPNFNAAEFEAGFKFASNPRIRQQLSALDNVEAGIGDLLRFSDAAQRQGVTILNRFVNPGGYAIGGRTYGNFAAARVAFADELSGALGFGGATDMSRQMGFDMTDPNLSPENFRSNILDVVQPFLDRKRNSLTDQMGPYGEPERERQKQPPSGADGKTTEGGPKKKYYNPKTKKLEDTPPQ